jgi:hypothetical protein
MSTMTAPATDTRKLLYTSLFVQVIAAIGLVLVLSVDWFIGMARALGKDHAQTEVKQRDEFMIRSI